MTGDDKSIFEIRQGHGEITIVRLPDGVRVRMYPDTPAGMKEARSELSLLSEWEEPSFREWTKRQLQRPGRLVIIGLAAIAVVVLFSTLRVQRPQPDSSSSGYASSNSGVVGQSSIGGNGGGGQNNGGGGQNNGGGQDPAVKRVCTDLAHLLSHPWHVAEVRRTVRSWKNLQFRNNANLNADSKILYDDAFTYPSPGLAQTTKDVKTMMKDCTKAGF